MRFSGRELTTCVESMKLTQIKIQINTLGSQKESSLFPKVAKAQLGMFYEEADGPAMRTGASVQVLVGLGAEHLLSEFPGLQVTHTRKIVYVT